MKAFSFKSKLALPVMVIFTISACAGTNPDGTQSSGINKSTGGTLLGGAAGGIIGSNLGKGKGKTAATIGGALLGGMAGHSVGSSLENADNAQYNQSNAVPINNNLFQNALENSRTGETTSWSNSDGSITRLTVNNTFTRNGLNCRNYTQSNGYTTNSGTACRNYNGFWN